MLSKDVDLAIVNSEQGRVAHEAIGYRPKGWRLIPNGFPMDVFRIDPDGGAATSRPVTRLRMGLGS